MAPVLIDFIKDDPRFDTEKAYSIVATEELTSDSNTNITLESHDIAPRLQNVRGSESQLTLEEHGLCYVNHDYDIDELASEEDMMIPYGKQVNDILRGIFKTDHVICYDLRWRRNTDFTHEEQVSHSRTVPSPPVRIAHIDHTLVGGWSRISRHLNGEEIKKYFSGEYRVRIVNTWRPLRHPVQDNPLAFIDPRTITADDMIEVDRVSKISLTEIYYLKNSDSHRWYWLSQQAPNESAVFVQFDSHHPPGKIHVVPHSSFMDPSAEKGCIPRESVETRSIVFTKL